MQKKSEIMRQEVLRHQKEEAKAREEEAKAREEEAKTRARIALLEEEILKAKVSK